MEFMLGCNYWASHAGTEMWANWDEEAVRADMKRCSEIGLKYLRVFPNWRDFQPVCPFYGGNATFYEYRDSKGRLFDNPYLLDMEMMDHFEKFCEIANEYGIKFIVGIITGWMSGRLFIPPVLEGHNLHSDFLALELEQKFIKGFVSRFCENEAIYAWDLGNECNVMCPTENRSEAFVWTAMIANAIRANDKTGKPVVSGMHGIGVSGNWTITDQGENTDILTTHPYPQFVPHCFKDDILSFRTLMHATSEGVYYASIGNKPCLTEEIGTLGPCTCDDDVAAGFLRTNLYSSWANGMMGVLWWCANEQVRLETPPYSWNMMERELGLFDINGKPKKMAEEYKKFDKFLKEFDCELPKAKIDGVCILTRQQDQWGAGYVSYMLAKLAGVNISFMGYENEIPESDTYIMPSVCGTQVISKEKFDELKRRVRDGATLYISNNDGYFAEFEEFTGVHIKNSKVEPENSVMEFSGEKLSFERKRKFMIESEYAIAKEESGEAVFTKHTYGKGVVYYLNFPLETMLLEKNYFEKGKHFKIYEEIFRTAKEKHIAKVSNEYIGLTIHEDEEKCFVVMINYSGECQKTGFEICDRYEIEKIVKGDIYELEPNEAAVVLIRKK